MGLGTKEAAPPDQAARDRIGRELESTLFVEAGAGSGKTTALVTRVVNLVVKGEAEMREIAAVTFTEKAATELRDRVRQELEKRAETADSTEVAARCAAALEQLDGAAVGTLHSFAQRILSENPVEAGLPPRVDVLDEVSSGVEFDRRWTAWRDQLLADPTLERTLLLLFASWVKADALRVLAAAFDDNWDLVAERVPTAVSEPEDVRTLIEPYLAELEAVCAEVERCLTPGDNLAVRLGEIADFVALLRRPGHEADILEALDPDRRDCPSFKVGNLGRQGDWDCDLKDLRARVREAGDELLAIRAHVAATCAVRLAAAMREFTLSAAHERRRDGRLDFHDLLVLARSVLRDREHGAAVRERLHRRYRKLLLDEFQDTDPIQIELAVRIAAADPTSDAAGESPWHEVAVTPGQLFVVGDPKQSIYRFRRADISTFLEAKERFGDSEGNLVELTANFRTGPEVITWVNDVFARLMQEEPDLLVPVNSRPDFVPLQAVRPPATAG
ncbi:MAG: UvrD-helicase domain-containing protein, partial [Acidimicrobiia bacterium]